MTSLSGTDRARDAESGKTETLRARIQAMFALDQPSKAEATRFGEARPADSPTALMRRCLWWGDTLDYSASHRGN